MPSLEGCLSLPDFNLVTSLAFFLLAGRPLDCSKSAPLSAPVEEVLSGTRAGILLHSSETLFLFPGANMCGAQVTTNHRTS